MLLVLRHLSGELIEQGADMSINGAWSDQAQTQVPAAETVTVEAIAVDYPRHTASERLPAGGGKANKWHVRADFPCAICAQPCACFCASELYTTPHGREEFNAGQKGCKAGGAWLV